MNRDQFRSSLAFARPPEGLSPLLIAMWYDARGDWPRAHKTVQAQSCAQAAHVHAYLHRKEGDLANADYWYKRAGKRRPTTGLGEEWAAIVDALLAEA